MSIGKRFKFQGTRFGVETGRSTPKVITAISLGQSGRAVDCLARLGRR